MITPETLRRIARSLAAIVVSALLLGYVAALYRSDPPSDRITDIRHFEDASAAMTLPEVFGQDFLPATPDHAGGFDGIAQWFRFKIARGRTPNDILLEIVPPSIDSVILYSPGETPQGWSVSRSGDTVPFAERASHRPAISFVIPRADAGHTFYLRVTSRSSTSFLLTAQDVTVADYRLDRVLALHIIYFALMVMGLLLAGLRLLEDRSELSFAIFAFVTTYIAYSLGALGYRPLLYDGPTPGFHDTLTRVTSVMTVFLSMVFQRFYLRRHQPHPWALMATDLLICLQALLFLPLSAGNTQVVAYGVIVLSLLFLGALVAMLATVHIRDKVVYRVLVAAYAVYMAVSGVRLVSIVGGSGTFFLTRHFIEVFGLTNLFLVILLIVLDRRDRIARDRSSALAFAAAQAEQGAHRRNAQTQTGFLHMLLHEVRNHLSVLRLGLAGAKASDGGLRVAQRVRDLDLALTKAQHLVWLDQGTWPLRPVPVSIIETLDRVIDTLGAQDRILPQGDAAEAEICADAALVDALLTYTLQTALSLAQSAGVVTVDLAQPAPDAACRLDLAFDLANKAATAQSLEQDFDMTVRIVAALTGSVALASPQAGAVVVTLILPR